MNPLAAIALLAASSPMPVEAEIAAAIRAEMHTAMQQIRADIRQELMFRHPDRQRFEERPRAVAMN